MQGEGAALAQGAFGRNVPAEQRANLAGDRQPQPGATVAAAERAVALLERPEDRVEVLRGDADAGVGDRERHHGTSVRGHLPTRGDPQQDLAPGGELDRVGQQVAEHLAQPLPIGEQLPGRFGGRLDREGQALLCGQRLESGPDVLQQRAQGEPLGGDVHPARLDLGQVQDVVDQLEQVRPGRVDDVGVLDLLRGEVPARVLSQQPGQDEQAVQRGAQLVRHVGQEL